MTDEEKAKEWVRTNSGYSVKEFHGQKAIEAFLAGLEYNKQIAELEKEKCENQQLTKAKEIIRDLLQVLPKENIEGVYEITEEAEQFLRKSE